MKKIKYFILFIIIIFTGCYLWYLFQMNKDYSLPATELYIEKGMVVKQIGADLQAAGYIHNDFLFRTYVWWHDLENKFFAGYYLLPEKISMKELIDILTGNNSYTPVRKLTIIEGWSLKNIGEYLSATMGFSLEDFYNLVGYPSNEKNNKNGQTVLVDFSNEFSFLNDKPKEYSLEGYLFPDTYEFALDAGVEQVVRKMLENFNSKLTLQMRIDVANQKKSIYEIITVASILEKELKTLDEKKLGAGLIYQRLELGMPLQMDSTINFITGKKSPQVSLSDLEIDSPYNTYKYKNLPPGPISNPGLDSLTAAVYPQESEYIYFLTDKDGRAHFATTYQEHLINKSRYLD